MQELWVCYLQVFLDEESIIKSYAIKLSLSLQLINILRDINEDLNLGRFYYPQDELKKFNLSESDFRKKIEKNESLRVFFIISNKKNRKYLQRESNSPSKKL